MLRAVRQLSPGRPGCLEQHVTGPVTGNDPPALFWADPVAAARRRLEEVTSEEHLLFKGTKRGLLSTATKLTPALNLFEGSRLADSPQRCSRPDEDLEAAALIHVLVPLRNAVHVRGDVKNFARLDRTVEYLGQQLFNVGAHRSGSAREVDVVAE